MDHEPQFRQPPEEAGGLVHTVHTASSIEDTTPEELHGATRTTERQNNNDRSGKKVMLRLDDAFCVHYNTTQQDTSGAKHMDPSDVTINICLATSPDMQGSVVRFFGTQSVRQRRPAVVINATPTTTTAAVTSFCVRQKPGYATLHWGHHPHETTPLLAGDRTNIILTFCVYDPSNPSSTQATQRSCYFPP